MRAVTTPRLAIGRFWGDLWGDLWGEGLGTG